MLSAAGDGGQQSFLAVPPQCIWHSPEHGAGLIVQHASPLHTVVLQGPLSQQTPPGVSEASVSP